MSFRIKVVSLAGLAGLAGLHGLQSDFRLSGLRLLMLSFASRRFVIEELSVDFS